jgi:hypothetical protein
MGIDDGQNDIQEALDAVRNSDFDDEDDARNMVLVVVGGELEPSTLSGGLFRIGIWKLRNKIEYSQPISSVGFLLDSRPPSAASAPRTHPFRLSEL